MADYEKTANDLVDEIWETAPLGHLPLTLKAAIARELALAEKKGLRKAADRQAESVIDLARLKELAGELYRQRGTIGPGDLLGDASTGLLRLLGEVERLTREREELRDRLHAIGRLDEVSGLLEAAEDQRDAALALLRFYAYEWQPEQGGGWTEPTVALLRDRGVKASTYLAALPDSAKTGEEK